MYYIQFRCWIIYMQNKHPDINTYNYLYNPILTFSPLKIDDWKTSLSFWGVNAYFSGANLGRVLIWGPYPPHGKIPSTSAPLISEVPAHPRLCKPDAEKRFFPLMGLGCSGGEWPPAENYEKLKLRSSSNQGKWQKSWWINGWKILLWL